MANKILVMGLPQTGKTTLAKHLKKLLTDAGKTVEWFNADVIRELNNDWDFSQEGRLRQAERMLVLADKADTDFVICDFVAPLPKMRDRFKPDWLIWMNTENSSPYPDTDKVFVAPETFDFRITEKNAEKWAKFIQEHLINNKRRPVFDPRKPTVQQLGRWQPWHAGHRALFERLLERTGQVCIMIRDCQDWRESNPFTLWEVIQNIERDLDPLYQGLYSIQVVPNIVHIGYGRKVGYTIAEEIFSEDITDISATEIRRQMGLK